MNDILCFSGGLDSYIAWHYLGKPPTIYFDTRLPHCAKELEMVTHITEGKVIIDHSLDFSSEKEIYIPHRNMLFASRASVYGDRVWIAGVKDDMVEDKTENAFNLMSICLSTIGKKNVTVDSPFWSMTKTDICKWYIKHEKRNGKKLGEIEYNLANKSISCYLNGTAPCYMCKSCFRKACAMYNSGLGYCFINGDMVKEYYNKALNENYIRQRNEDICRFAEWYLSVY